LLELTGSLPQAYAGVFWIEALGALACIWLLRRVDVLGFAGGQSRTSSEAFAAAD
jgi:hypothetical protein